MKTLKKIIIALSIISLYNCSTNNFNKRKYTPGRYHESSDNYITKPKKKVKRSYLYKNKVDKKREASFHTQQKQKNEQRNINPTIKIAIKDTVKKEIVVKEKTTKKKKSADKKRRSKRSFLKNKKSTNPLFQYLDKEIIIKKQKTEQKENSSKHSLTYQVIWFFIYLVLFIACVYAVSGPASLATILFVPLIILFLVLTIIKLYKILSLL